MRTFFLISKMGATWSKILFLVFDNQLLGKEEKYIFELFEKGVRTFIGRKREERTFFRLGLQKLRYKGRLISIRHVYSHVHTLQPIKLPLALI